MNLCCRDFRHKQLTVKNKHCNNGLTLTGLDEEENVKMKVSVVFHDYFLIKLIFKSLEVELCEKLINSKYPTCCRKFCEQPQIREIVKL